MTRPLRPHRDDYARCCCAQVQAELGEVEHDDNRGPLICGGCEEYQAVRDRWARYELEGEAAADALADLAKDDELLGRR